MPLYDFQCIECGHEFEEFAKIRDRLNVNCPVCSSTCKVLMSPWKEDWFKPFVSEDFDGTPIEVKSKGHYKELCKKHGCYARVFGRGYNLGEI